jgi:UDP-2-acetamido-2,6-beta-L-arabino-hexul-4-ose reductase
MTARCIAITGSDGFIGRNLSLRLAELDVETLSLTRASLREDWFSAAARADAVVHLAGANRPVDDGEFDIVNAGSAALLVAALEAAGRPIPVIYSSSIRASGDDPYGRSKRAGEEALLNYGARSGAPVHVFRLHNVFGKWARPNYNSAVATFCHNIARDMPITINNQTAPLSLVYIDDVIAAFIDVLDGKIAPGKSAEVVPVYATTVGEVASIIRGFRSDRNDNLIDAVGTGLTRALYATYVAALPPDKFSYEIASHRDPRGAFSEMLKTRDAGQFSYFTALPGVTRGGHYHHTKTEKFLIVHGKARFGFRHVLTGETHEIITDGETPTIVETVPGWAHDVTNVGDDIMVSLLWANEIFDRARPDTIAAKV